MEMEMEMELEMEMEIGYLERGEKKHYVLAR
jgi:hypothetical protein